MKTNNWREEFDKIFAHAHGKTFSFGMGDDSRNITADEFKDFTQSLLDKQKEEIIERIIKAVDDTCYLNEQGSTVIADSHIDRLIKQIKEI